MRDGEQRAVGLFHSAFDAAPTHVVRAPGRVNLIGDHTDYNDGFVLPMAIERATWVALRLRDDRRVRLVSEGYPEAEFALDPLDRTGLPWVQYVKGVAWALGPESVAGWEGAVATDLPVGAGLSSSAALELAAARAFWAAAGKAWDPPAAARAAQRAEVEWVGMACGIMDQLVVACAEAGRAFFLDCRSLGWAASALPAGTTVVVLDTGTRRDLVASAYNERRAACEEAAARLGLAALRDAGEDDLARLPAGALRRRARHVITENARTAAAAEALQRGDAAAVGALMVDSHRSLRDDFEVSSAALDAMVAAALAAPGCLGARLTGAGFGGSAVALVESRAVEAFVASALAAYGSGRGSPAAYPSGPAAGVECSPWRQT
jgi:galactokinase